MRSPMTTHCYLETEDAYLMLHRVSKKNDVNKDKWIGVGGHLGKKNEKSHDHSLLSGNRGRLSDASPCFQKK